MTRLREQYYFRTIDRRWRKELCAAKGRVLVFSPFITSETADLVLNCVSPSKCEIHTVLSAESFAAGASSIRTLKNLMKRGFAIFEIAELHAKVMIAEGSFASIGSQNLTRKAVTNLEATVTVSKPREIAAIMESVRPWLAARTAVTGEMLADLERQLPGLQREFRNIRRKAVKIDSIVRESAERRSREAKAQSLRQSLTRRFGDGEVSEQTAKYFIEESIWWLKHRYHPVRAPRYARRVYRSNQGWCLDLGANTFLVEIAIKRCRGTIESVIDEAVAGNAILRGDLLDRLRRNVRGAVANCNGEEYKGYYPVHGRDMRFGAQAIDVDDFIGVFLQQVPLSELTHDDNDEID